VPRKANKTEYKDEMWDRLSAPAETLDLDDRSDEEPEDYFVRLCSRGSRAAVLRALKANLCEVITQVKTGSAEVDCRFLQRALRLCDTVGAEECKPDLKYFLLHNAPPNWAQWYQNIKELAARALDGMPKEPGEFQYWKHLAEQADAILPYALNALLEIDLDEGLGVLLKMYVDFYKQKRTDEIDWEVILQLAADTHGMKKLGVALDKHLGGQPDYYEYFVRIGRMPELSRAGKRSLKEIAGYGGMILESDTKMSVAGDKEAGYGRQSVPTETLIKRREPSNALDYISSGGTKIPDDSIYLKFGFVPLNKAYLLRKNP
jgi:hypothetical protein